ncbi:MAG: gspJ [Burkholderiales bacterium]|jgi:general secretion pathway protein J|nr:gspJ [Burkholderiales bacterium]
MYIAKRAGFTLIELMVAILIFSIISIISYRTLASLVTTKQIVTTTQDRWSGIVNTVNLISNAWARSIPLTIRDENGSFAPAVIGKNKLERATDAQLELTLSGYISDPVYGTIRPRRLGFRFVDNKLFLVTWPVLNRVRTTQPQLDLLMDDVASFQQSFIYPDKQWHDEWPPAGIPIDQVPLGLKITIVTKKGETVMRQFVY